jgi:hypothetical protein
VVADLSFAIELQITVWILTRTEADGAAKSLLQNGD